MGEAASGKQIVLVTGSAGAIGRFVCGELGSRGHQVRGFDRRPSPWVDDNRIGDLTDPQSMDAAMAGCNAVVHLAATPDEDNFMEKLLPNNVVGLYHVCQLALRHKVRRLVLTSSVQVTWGLDSYGKRPVRLDEGTAPVNHYALAKVWAEAMGEMYSRLYDMSIIVIRPGWLPRGKEMIDRIDRDQWHQCYYLSPGDAGRAFALAVEAENVRFAVIPAQSRGRKFDAMDLSSAKQVTGYEPRDTWPEGTDRLLDVPFAE